MGGKAPLHLALFADMARVSILSCRNRSIGETMNNLVDLIAAQLWHLTPEQIVALVCDFVSELDPGIILVQAPLPGDEVAVGSYVNITLSTTEEPELAAETTDEAEGEEEGGFKFWW